MIRYCLLCWGIFLVPLLGKEITLEVFSYYVGKGATEDWLYRFQIEESDVPIKLSQAPFESRFFREGDVLWDLRGRLKEEVAIKEESAHLVLNETTSRLVVKANRWAHTQVKALTKSIEQPFQVSGKIVFFEVPRTGFFLSDWNENNLPPGTKKLAEIEMTGKPGEKISAKLGDPAIEIEWENGIWSPYRPASNRLTIGAGLVSERINKEFFLKTSFLNLMGTPVAFALGNVESKERTILCSFVSDIQLVDGTPMDERTLSEEGKLPELQREIDDAWSGHYRMKNPETGKIFVVFRTPPTLPAFLDSTNEDKDPFLEEKKTAKLRPYKGKDERILTTNLDRLVDLRELLSQNGVKITAHDLAAFDPDQGLLYVETSEKNIDFVEAILGSGPGHTPINIICSFSLFEADRKFTVAELNRKDIEVIGQASSITLPGLKSELELESGDLILNVECEPNLGGGASGQIDFRGEFVLEQGEETLYQWCSGIVLRAGQPKILQQGSHGKKWQALVMECRLETMIE